MTRQDGADMLLKIGDGGAPEAFAVIGGLRNVALEVTRELAANSAVNGDIWGSVLEAAGGLSVVITGGGYFADSAAEETLRGHVFAATQPAMKLSFGNGDTLSGNFAITRYSRLGSIDGQEDFTVALKSSGSVAFVKG
jgi:TP901-1 family phage major tail protein